MPAGGVAKPGWVFCGASAGADAGAGAAAGVLGAAWLAAGWLEEADWSWAGAFRHAAAPLTSSRNQSNDATNLANLALYKMKTSTGIIRESFTRSSVAPEDRPVMRLSQVCRSSSR
jgi:hypothetical protein